MECIDCPNKCSEYKDSIISDKAYHEYLLKADKCEYMIAERIYKAFIYDMRDADIEMEDIAADIINRPKEVIAFLLPYGYDWTMLGCRNVDNIPDDPMKRVNYFFADEEIEQYSLKIIEGLLNNIELEDWMYGRLS